MGYGRRKAGLHYESVAILSSNNAAEKNNDMYSTNWGKIQGIKK